MKKLLLSFLPVLLLIKSYAQQKMPEFGKPSLEELLMKECEFEKDASAMKLVDYRESEFILDYTIKIETERRVRIKIFNEKGFNEASIKIPYNGRKRASKITDISAYIYNLDADNKITVQKIEKKQILKDKSNEGVSTVAFTFPNLKAGSVIEYRYKKTDKNSVHFEPWFFQDNIPVQQSVCKIIKPSIVQLDTRFITNDSVIKEYKHESPNYLRYLLQTYTYSLNQVQSFKEEPLMSSAKDNLQRAEFALMPSMTFGATLLYGKGRWGFFNMLLTKAPFFGGQVNNKIPGTESIIDSANRMNSIAEKTDFIYQKIKSKIVWDKSQTFYADSELEEVWKEGTGNSAEINLLLLNLLRKVKNT